MTKLILSPVGTSLLTNAAETVEDRKLLNKHTNDKDEIPDKLKSLVTELEVSILNKFQKGTAVDELKKMSAELNSLLNIYDGRLEGNKRDIHFLIATDTFLGRETSEILKGYLKEYFDLVEVFTPEKLSTRSKDTFESGVRSLLKWCDDTINGYKRSKYEIIFNLTGGFKSLQGYLNTIGMFYADKIVYIFETSGELITIPKLPIQIEESIFKTQAAIFLQLSQADEGIEQSYLLEIPETLLEEIGNNKFTLSDWGILLWNKIKENILTDRLITLPHISYTNLFVTDFKKTSETVNRIQLQEKIAKVSYLLQEHNGDISILRSSGGFQYENMSGRNDHLGHFRINQGSRVSCEYKSGILELRHYGKHDYVNDNP